MTTRADILVPSTKQKIVYSDFQDDFGINELTGDLIIITNEDAVKQSLSNLILRAVEELPYSPEGSISKKLLFEQIDSVTSTMLQQTITESIQNYQKNVILQSLIVTPNPDSYSYNVTINFQLTNSQTVYTLNQVLTRVR